MTTDEIRRRFLKTSAMALGGGALLGPAFDRLASDVPTGPIAITHGTVTGDVTMTVDLKRQDGTLRHRTVIAAV